MTQTKREDKQAIKTIPDGYESILKAISSKIRSAQARAMITVNRELIEVYREIGKTIYEHQENGEWGDAVVKTLALDLQKSFPGMKGFSSRNLWRMKDFYLSYRGNKKVTTLSSQISWSHNVALLSKCKSSIEREFYMLMTKRNGWSYRILLHHIEIDTFAKTISSQNNFEKNLPDNLQPEAKLAVKDDYSFGFLELEQKHRERELERAIVRNIEGFLREIGSSYSFIGSQHRVEVDGREFFIDLLLFHRKLKCLVAFELKVGDFIPEYIGKMQFYLAVLDDKVRLEGENPSIGIILCKSKSKTIVEYTLKNANSPINVSSYYATKEVPEQVKRELPSEDQVKKLLEVL